MSNNFFLSPKKGGNIRVRFTHNNRECSYSTGTKNLAKAKIKAKIIYQDFNKKHTTLSSNEPLINLTEIFVKNKEVKEITKKSLTRNINRALKYLPQKAKDLSSKDFEKSAYLIKGNSSAKTWANILADCRGFFRWCVKNDFINSDPTINIPNPKKINFGKRQESDMWIDSDFSVLDILPKFERNVVEIIRWTGIDLRDVFTLTKNDFVKTKNGYNLVRLRAKAKSTVETVVQPLSKNVERLILNFVKSKKEIKNLSSTTTQVCKRLKQAFKSLDIPPKTTKGLRHTFTTYHAKRGVPMHILRQWMGHAPSSRILESIYTHISDTSEFMD